MLIEIIDGNRSVETTVSTIEGILATGQVKYKGSNERIAPNVLTALKKAWEG